jgi:hypothetical protein
VLPDPSQRQQAYALAEHLGLALTELHHPVIDVGGPSPGTVCSCRRPACDAIGKHPRRKGWAQNPLPAARQMVAAFSEVSNLGVVTGAMSRCVVLDVDPRNGGDAALDEWEGLRPGGSLPSTFTADTPSGGFHLYFRLPEGVDAGQREFLPGVDVRGRNGLVVFPTSVGANGRAYRVRDGAPLALAPCPGDVLARVRLVPASPAGMRPLPPAARSIDMARRAQEASLGIVASAPPGRRNETLNVHAYGIGVLCGAGVLEVLGAARLLVEAAVSSGLPPSEAVGTTLSGLLAGLGDQAPDHVESARAALERMVGR